MEDRKKWNCEVGTHESGYTGDVASLGRFVYGEVKGSDLTQKEGERETTVLRMEAVVRGQMAQPGRGRQRGDRCDNQQSGGLEG